MTPSPSLIFHKKSTKLAGLYLAIMMAISIFFSLNVYQLSTQEFDRGFRGPGTTTFINQLPTGGIGGGYTVSRDVLIQEREQQFKDARNRVLTRLIVTNIVILIGGGILSYYLALRTLRPIEEAHEAQSRFTADASHELRTPIAAMQTEIEVALMNPKLSLSDTKNLLKSNLEELGKLTNLSEGLLSLAQMEDSELKGQKVKVKDVVNGAVARVLPLAEKKRILITQELGKNLQLWGDATSIQEALLIILDNAVKYSPDKTEISIMADHKQKNVEIRIKDQGIGIKATELPHIFDRFYRADAARSKQHVSGYGIGLAIARNIADMHNGSLTATSKPGKGSVFTLSLPSI